MITVEGVTRRYGNFTPVDKCELHRPAGPVTGFLGANGAGKSTTMRIMVGLTRATSGMVTSSGRRYSKPHNPGLDVGVLLDASAQHAGRTGREVLTIAQQYLGLSRHRVQEMLNLVGLTPTEASRRVGNTPWACANGSVSPLPLSVTPRRFLDEPRQRPGPSGYPLAARPDSRLRRPRRPVLSSHLLHEIEVIAHDFVMIGNGRVVS